MKNQSVLYLALIGRDENGSPYATDQMGIPGKYEDLKELVEICSEILASKSPEQIDQYHEEVFRARFPSMYAQLRSEHELPEVKEERKRQAVLKKIKQGSRPPIMVGKFRKPGYIYLAFNPDTNLYKIGLSKNVKSRLRALTSDQGTHIKLIHSFAVNSMSDAEADLHKRFVDKHVYSEWFALTTADVEFIKAIGGVA